MRTTYLNCLTTLLISTALCGCMVGPDFHSPHAPQTNSYTEKPSPKKTVSVANVGASGKAQYFISGEDISASWWRLFHSEKLNHLIEIGLANSPNLQAAEAAIVQAQETLNAQIGSSLYPNVSTQLSATRQRLSNATFGVNSPPSLFSLYNASVNVSYTLDVFGGARRELESLQAQVDYQQFQWEAAYLTLTSNIVTTAVTIASLRAQIKATHEIIQEQTHQLDILVKQLKVGGASGANVLTQQTQLAQTRATLPPLEKSLAQANHSLSVLIGDLPSESHLPEFNLDTLQLPGKLPVSLPSSLAHQRPDIRASEALLHAASGQIGVATANLYPQITLSGAEGWTSFTPANLFSRRNNAWSIGGSLLQPIFNGGSLRAKKRAAIAAYEQADAQYRQVVLQAFQNVADTLRALQDDAQTLRAQRQAEISARDSLRITEKQYEVGGVSYLSLLTAQQQYQTTKIARIQAEAARYTDTAALFQALGGGWWNREGDKS